MGEVSFVSIPCVCIRLVNVLYVGVVRSGGKSLMLEAGQVTEMLERNIIAPYKFTKVS